MKAAPHSIPADKLACYERLVATNPAVERKGKANPYTSFNGHMFTLLGPTGQLALRLPKDAREQFLKQYQTDLFESHGHVMPEFVAVPDWLLADTMALEPYFSMSYAYVASLRAKPSAAGSKRGNGPSSRKRSS